MKPSSIAILAGPTATGKSDIAMSWAQHNPRLEIINADSLQVYRELDIGTAKPTPEEMNQVPHHLVNLILPNEVFTAADFARRARVVAEDIRSRGKIPLIVGGTGFYLKALLFGVWDAPSADAQIRGELEAVSSESLHARLEKVDPLAAKRIGLADRYRLIRALEIHQLTGKTPTELERGILSEPDPSIHLWVIDREDSELTQRIAYRTRAMIRGGIVDEFKAASKAYPDSRALRAVGYAQVAQYLSGKAPSGRKVKPGFPGLEDEISLATRQLVKSQRTWFRGLCVKVPGSKRLLLEQDRELLQQLFHEYCEE